MKKYLVFAIMIGFSVAAVSSYAVAESKGSAPAPQAAAPSVSPPPPPPPHFMMGDPMKMMEDDFAAHFKERKETALKTMDDTIKSMQKQHDCAKAASDVKAIKECSPSIVMMSGYNPMMAPPPAPAAPAVKQ